jgi:hypothetical protein
LQNNRKIGTQTVCHLLTAGAVSIMLAALFILYGGPGHRKNFSPSTDKRLSASSGGLNRLFTYYFCVFLAGIETAFVV